MQFDELENKSLIRRTKINFKQIYNFLSRSRLDLQTSKSNLSIDSAWSYAIAYHAMLRAGRSLMMSLGYRRNVAKYKHLTLLHQGMKKIITVSYQSVKAATANPVKALRYELR